MKKKFNVRVVHHTGWSYRIEFAHYYIFRIWNPMCQYLDLGANTDLSCYNPVLLGYDEAVAFAEELKNIDDVIEFQKKEADKKIKSDKNRLGWMKRNTPVGIKNIL